MKAVNEDDLLFLFTIVCGTLSAALFVRILLHFAVRLISPLHAGACRRASLICVFLAVLFSLRTGLTLYLVILSTGFALVAGAPSPPRVIGAFLLTFAFLCATISLVTSMAPLRMTPVHGIWASRFYGEVALWPPSGDTETDNDNLLRFLLVRHDAVSLDCELCADTAVRAGTSVPPVVHIVSVAERTRIRALGGGDAMYRVALLGPRPCIEDTTLRLAPDASLRLAPDATLVNVAVEQYDRSGRVAFLGFVRAAEDCAAAVYALKAQSPTPHSLPLRCEPLTGGAALLQMIGDPALVPREIAAAVPLALRLQWRVPDTVLAVQRAARFVTTHAGSFPYACAVDAVVMARAAHCVVVRGIRVSQCGAGDWRARVGAGAAAALRDALRVLLDTLDVIPGLGMALAWAWRVEWDLTQLTAQWIWKTVCMLAQWTFLALQYLLGWVGCVMQWFAPAVSGAGAVVSSYLWNAQASLVAVLCDALVAIAHVFAAVVFAALGLVWEVLSWGHAAAMLYGSTSLSAHVFIAIVQSALLGVALRNEVRELSQREEGKVATWVRRIPGSDIGLLMTTFLRVHSVESARYAIIHFVLLSMLTGLSLVHLMVKLYNITLYIIFPWASSHAFLSFFVETPRHAEVLLFSVLKGVSVVAVDCTIGSFVAHALREFMIFLSVILLFAGTAGAWRKGVIAWAFRIYTKLAQDNGNVRAVTTGERTATVAEESGEVAKGYEEIK